jgi:hypothetical protein
MTRYLLLFDSYGLVDVGRPLRREDESVFCICCYPLPAESFSGPSPLGLATVFHCLRFETSLFVASYDTQGHGGGIRPRLHTGSLLSLQKSKSKLLYDRTENTYYCVFSRCRGNNISPEMFPSNGCCTVAEYAAVTYQWIYMTRYSLVYGKPLNKSVNKNMWHETMLH